MGEAACVLRRELRMSLPVLLLGVGAVVWAGYLLAFFRIRGSVPRVSGLSPPSPVDWPTVSMIIPARNEACEIEPALRSKLAVDYPAFELVVVDDRSTDQTGEIVDALAKEDPRILPLHLQELPPGWLGKLHAMARGIERARGSFLLLTDADVHIAPGTLRTLVAWAEEQGIDHIAAVPRLDAPNRVLHCLFQAVMRLVVVAFRPWAISNRSSTASAGIGAFNLVRRDAYERTPGLAWLRMEVGDDAGLGQMLKLSGARCALVNACDEVSLRFSPSLSAMARQMEKTSGLGGRLPLTFGVASLLAWIVEMSPWIVLAWPGVGLGLRVAAMAVCGLALLDAALFAVWSRAPLSVSLLVPLGATLLALIGLRAAALAALRGGIVWRGTFYARQELAAGARYQLWPRRAAPGLNR
jgi:hypothetical protein